MFYDPFGLMVVLLTVFYMVSVVVLMGSSCYSRVWNLRTKLCCIGLGK